MPPPPDIPEGPQGPPRSRRLQALEAKIARTYMAPAKGVAMVAHGRQDPELMKVAQDYAELVPVVADAWVELAGQNPRVLEILESAAEGGVIGTLIVTHCMMVTTIVPGEVLVGIVKPLATRVGDIMDRRRQARDQGVNGHGPA